MKLKDFYDVTLKTYIEIMERDLNFEKHPKAMAASLFMLGALGVNGPQVILNMPIVKRNLDTFVNVGLFDPETREINSEMLFAGLDNYLKAKKPFQVNFLEIKDIEYNDLDLWVNRLKEVR